MVILGKLKKAVKHKNMEINAAMEFQNTIKKQSKGFDFLFDRIISTKMTSKCALTLGLGVSDALTLIREFRKKFKMWDRHRARFTGKNPERSVASFVYVPLLWIFFPENALGDGPKKWHIFLFSTAYFRTYWHMPFKIYIIR